MKVLLVSYSYRPSLTPRAFRWSAIAEHWASQGHHVDVVCEASNDRATLEVINGVRVHRVGNAKPFRWGSQSAAPGGDAPTSAYHGASRQNALRSRVRNMLREAWRKLYWPDYAFLWYRPAVKKTDELLSGDQYDVLYSSSIPFTGHLVGLAMKKRHPGLRWVVDTGDPFSFSDGAPVNNFALYGNLNTRVEREVFAGADAISVTTEGTKKRYCQLFPFVDSKISVIPPLLSPSVKSSSGPDIFPRDGKIRLVFVGTLYKDIRSPADLLSCFSRLLELDMAARLELHFFGEIGGCRELFESYSEILGKKIFLHGLVPQNEAARAMRDADILVNIGNNTEYQLPSKVVEYAAMMKPILNFVLSSKDSSAEFLGPFEGVLSIPAESFRHDTNFFDRISAFLRDPPKIDREERERILWPFRPEEVAAAYLDL